MNEWIQGISVISLLLGIFSTLLAIGSNVKSGNLLRGIASISVCIVLVVFSKILFECFFRHWTSWYTFSLCISIMIVLIAAVRDGDIRKLRSLLKEDNNKLAALVLFPFIGLIANAIFMKNQFENLGVTSYIETLATMKISVDAFEFMGKHIQETLYLTGKFFEITAMNLVGLKAARMLWKVSTNDLGSFITCYEKYKFTSDGLIMDFVVFALFSTNIFSYIIGLAGTWF